MDSPEVDNDKDEEVQGTRKGKLIVFKGEGIRDPKKGKLVVLGQPPIGQGQEALDRFCKCFADALRVAAGVEPLYTDEEKGLPPLYAEKESDEEE